MGERRNEGGVEGSSAELPGAGVEWENEEEGVDEGWKGEEGSVLGPGGGEGEGRQRFWHAGSLCPLHGRGCNLGHVSHKAFWAIHLS